MSKNFGYLKEKLVSNIVLRGSDWDLLFHIHINALERPLGVVLGKQDVA